MYAKSIPAHLNMQAQVIVIRSGADKHTRIFTLRFTDTPAVCVMPPHRAAHYGTTFFNADDRCGSDAASCPDPLFSLWAQPPQQALQEKI